MLLANNIVDVYEITDSNGIQSYPNTPTLSSLAICIIPATLDQQPMYDVDGINRLYKAFSKTPIQQTAKLVDQDGKTYIVKSAEYRRGLLSHHEFILAAGNAES